MTLVQYRIILATLVISCLGGIVYYTQHNTLRISSMIQDVIASSTSSGSGVGAPSEIIQSRIDIETLMSKRYLYTLSRYMETEISRTLQKSIKINANYQSFDRIYREGDDFVFAIGSNELIRIPSSMYFFDRYNTSPLTLSSEGGYQTGSSRSKMIALTFDDGPSPKYTEILLDILKREGVVATFFVLGKNAEMYPKILKRTYNEGHEIGNHSYSHTLFTKISPDQIQEELYTTDQAIYRAIGVYPSLFRPPYGGTNTGMLSDIPMVFAMWSIDSRDWRTRNIVKNIASISNAKAGDILIMHDIHEESIASIPTIIASLKARGFTFVTVSQILDLSRENEQIGKKCYRQGDCR